MLLYSHPEIAINLHKNDEGTTEKTIFDRLIIIIRLIRKGGDNASEVSLTGYNEKQWKSH